MCKVLTDAASVYHATEFVLTAKRMLFIFSDGKSTDGDPRPVADR